MLINGKEIVIAPYANLRDANLRGADLRDANLRGANLRGADLRGTDLRDANLRGADLRGTDLRGTDLRGANLCGTDLCGANLETFKVCRMDFGGWSILVLPDTTTIGCQTHPNTDWLRWTPEDVRHMAEGAFEFWSQHGASVCAVIRDVMDNTAS